MPNNVMVKKDMVEALRDAADIGKDQADRGVEAAIRQLGSRSAGRWCSAPPRVS